MPTKRERELETENARLRALVLTIRNDTPQDMGVAGRIAITRLRDTDYPDLQRAVNELPHLAREKGSEYAIAVARTTIRSLIDAIVLRAPRTPNLVTALHRIHMLLNEGMVELLIRSDRIGYRARTALLEAVERFAFAPSVRAAFDRGLETPAGLPNVR